MITTNTEYRLGRKAFMVFLSRRLTAALVSLVIGIVLLFGRQFVFGGTAQVPTGAGAQAASVALSVLSYATALAFLMALLFLLVGMLASWVEYKGYAFTFEEFGLKMRRGLITREEVSIPYRQMQDINVRRSLAYQLMGVSRLVIDSAGHEDEEGDESDVTLEPINKDMAEEIRQFLQRKIGVQIVKDEAAADLAEQASHGRGFTLIEILVVVSIISMLSSVVLVSVNVARAKARDSVRTQNIHQIDLAVRQYMIDHNGKAPDLQGLCSASAGSAGTDPSSACLAVSTQLGTVNGQPSAWTRLGQDLAPYMSGGLPLDPCANGCGGVDDPDSLAYTYESPAVISYLCGTGCVQGGSQLDQSYGLSAGMETTATTSVATPPPPSASVTANIYGHGAHADESISLVRTDITQNHQTVPLGWVATGVWNGYTPPPCTVNDATGLFSTGNGYTLPQMQSSGTIYSNPNPLYIHDGAVSVTCYLDNPGFQGATVTSHAVNVTFQ